MSSNKESIFPLMQQHAAMQLGIKNINQLIVFEFLRDATAWAEYKYINREKYFWIARNQICSGLPLLGLLPDLAYRHLKFFDKVGLIKYIKHGKKDFVFFTEKSLLLPKSSQVSTSPSFLPENLPNLSLPIFVIDPISEESFTPTAVQVIQIINDADVFFSERNQCHIDIYRAYLSLNLKSKGITIKEFENSMEAFGLLPSAHKVQRKVDYGADSSKKGFVYFIKEKSNGFTKIGRAKDLKNRLKLFSVKLPFHIEFDFSFECHDCISAEKILHEFFCEKNINGEWFNLSEDDLLLVKNYSFLNSKNINVISNSGDCYESII